MRWIIAKFIPMLYSRYYKSSVNSDWRSSAKWPLAWRMISIMCSPASPGFTQLVCDNLPAAAIEQEYLSEVLAQARRAADLTHQTAGLQPSANFEVHPPLNVNQQIREIIKTLNVLIGEHIELGMPPDRGVGLP